MSGEGRAARRFWTVVILAVVALFAAVGVIRWSLAKRTPAERNLSGIWLHEPEPGPGIPVGTRHRWEFAPNGRFLLRLLEPEEPAHQALAGKWWSRDGILFVEPDLPEQPLAGRFESFVQGTGTRIHEFEILKLEAQELIIRLETGEQRQWIRSEDSNSLNEPL